MKVKAGRHFIKGDYQKVAQDKVEISKPADYHTLHPFNKVMAVQWCIAQAYFEMGMGAMGITNGSRMNHNVIDWMR